MAQDFATSYAEIFKYDKNDDGTLTVYGKATSDDLDIDNQICDNDWLSRAVPEWFKSGGNIREQHSSIAAGVATEYEQKGDGFYVEAKIVDPNSIRKVEHKVLKGFSIGIKGPRVIRDQKAANGRIIDGQIVELSLVDRPANPTCQLVLAKSVGGESTLTQVEELIVKYSPDQERDEHGRFGGGSGGGSNSNGWTPPNGEHGEALGKIQDRITQAYGQAFTAGRVPGQPMSPAVMDIAQAKDDAQGHLQEAHENLLGGNNSAAAESMRNAASVLTDGTGSTFDSHAADLRALADRVESKSKSVTPTKETPVAKSVLAETILELVKSANGDSVKFDQASYDTARRALAQLIITEAGEMADGSDERDDIEELIDAIKHLFRWKDGEDEEGETNDMSGMTMEMSAKEANPDCDCDGCAACKADGGCDKTPCAKCAMAKSASISKCLECGCHVPGDSHGASTVQIAGNNSGISTTANVSTAASMDTSGSIKSAEGEEPVAAEEAPAEEAAPVADASEEAPAAEEAATPEILDEATKSAIIEKAVKSATETVKTEIASLQAATKAAEEKVVALESELVAAKSAAVAGGPKRTGRIAVTQTNELLLKAAEYKAKALATSDPILVKGYKALEKEFLSKAGKPVDQD